MKRHVRSTVGLLALTGFLMGSSCPPGASDRTSSAATIRFLDLDGTENEALSEVSVIHTASGACTFRLEYLDPTDPDWGIHQIGGTPPLEEIAEASCDAPPSFVTTRAANALHFEQQTAYFWLKEAREYAKQRFWLTPGTFPLDTINFARTRVDTTISTAAEFHTLACHPLEPITSDGCMRAWPLEGPRIYFENGTVSGPLVAHEYGHYAAGYVFGYMDPLGLNGFAITQCGHRAFQETLADMFKDMFLHERLPGSPVASTDDAIWDGACGPTEYDMGRPFVQAFQQALWGQAFDGSNVVPWGSRMQANRVMAEAFAHALAMRQGHDIAALANGILLRLQDQGAAIADPVRGIFNLHRFALQIGDECPLINGQPLNSACMACISSTDCHAGRCDTTTLPSRCIPPDGTGAPTDYCTHNNHCQSGSCNVGIGCN